MATFIFRCPRTGFNVQAFTAGNGDRDNEAYEAITCIACQRVHLVNPTTGKIVADDDD
ncbi:MAG: hypothetical protein WAK97_09565 [Pseudolabrys sp.]